MTGCRREPARPRHRRRQNVSVVRPVVDCRDVSHDLVARRRKRVDDRVNRVDEDHRADHRQGDLPEGFPAGSAVNGAGLVNCRRDGLEAGEEDQHLDAAAVYDVEDVVDHLHNVFHDFGTDHHVVEEPFHVQDGNDLRGLGFLTGTVVDTGGVLHVGAQGVGAVDIGDQTGGQDDRDEEDGTERGAPDNLLVQDDRDEQGEDDDGGNVEDELSQTGHQRRDVGRIDEERVGVVLPADEFKPVAAAHQDLDLVEGVLDRVEDDGQVDQNEAEEEGEYEYPAGLCLLGFKRGSALFLFTGGIDLNLLFLSAFAGVNV